MQSTSTILNKLFSQPEWTEEEMAWLLTHLDEKDSPELLELMQNRFDENLTRTSPVNNARADKLLQRIHLKMNAEQPVIPAHRVRFLKTAWFRYAAILLLLAGTAAYFYTSSSFRGTPEIAKTETKQKDIQPGGNKAILTLSDGSTILLDSAANGNLAQQGNTSIIKLSNGQLAYNPSQNPVSQPSTLTSPTSYNTIATPTGGQYQIVLSDGTKVWLNAASSIKFPTAFDAKERRVEATGEVYFEVKNNSESPFIVVARGTQVQVLGTSFNINAYMDEPAVKTSLLEGSVKIDNTVLKPGQAYRAGKLISANTEQDIAWKNGFFSFQNADMATFGRQMQRWYGIQVKYEGTIPAIEFKGKMDRGVPLSGVLRFLSEYGIKTRLNNSTLVIMGD